MTATTTRRPRALARALHRWLGLATAAFLAVAGLTGAVLVFHHEVEGALHPSLLRATPPLEGAAPLDPLVLRERLERALPAGSRVLQVPLRHEPGRATSFWVDLPAGAAAGDDEYFVSPYTGEVLGSRRWGDLGQGLVNLVPFLYRLHYSLALGDVGALLLGWAAVLWTLDCFVAAWITLPPRAPRSPGPSWLARWRPSWVVKGRRAFALIFTGHRAAGLWIWALLLVFAWSSVSLNLPGVYRPVTRAALGLDPDGWERLPTLPAPRPPGLPWTEALRLGRDAMGAAAMEHGFTVLAERRLAYDAERGAFRYQVRSTRDVSDRYPGTSVWLDGVTGATLAVDLPTGRAAGTTVTTWLHHLHFGTVAAGGLPYRVVVSVMGLLVAALSVSGAWLWWRRRDVRGVRRATLEALPEDGGRATCDPARAP